MACPMILAADALASAAHRPFWPAIAPQAAPHPQRMGRGPRASRLARQAAPVLDGAMQLLRTRLRTVGAAEMRRWLGSIASVATHKDVVTEVRSARLAAAT